VVVVRESFVRETIEQLIEQGILGRTDHLLAVCASTPERELFESLDFDRVVISNITADGSAADGGYPTVVHDVQRLAIHDSAFDFAFVSDGLHHCSSPHRALLEMYRVARKGVIVFEARDSLLMRIATKLRFSATFELGAVTAHGTGGVDNGPIPNFIYRWNERELEKTISSFNPRGRHRFIYFRALHLPGAHSSLDSRRSRLVKLIEPFARLLAAALPSQSNTLAMVVLKPDEPDDLWPWVRAAENRPG
jgi:SAM-dependent methyltransferase